MDDDRKDRLDAIFALIKESVGQMKMIFVQWNFLVVISMMLIKAARKLEKCCSLDAYRS